MNKLQDLGYKSRIESLRILKIMRILKLFNHIKEIVISRKLYFSKVRIVNNLWNTNWIF
jgi:hypothetical protein